MLLPEGSGISRLPLNILCIRIMRVKTFVFYQFFVRSAFRVGHSAASFQ